MIKEIYIDNKSLEKMRFSKEELNQIISRCKKELNKKYNNKKIGRLSKLWKANLIETIIGNVFYTKIRGSVYGYIIYDSLFDMYTIQLFRRGKLISIISEWLKEGDVVRVLNILRNTSYKEL